MTNVPSQGSGAVESGAVEPLGKLAKSISFTLQMCLNMCLIHMNLSEGDYLSEGASQQSQIDALMEDLKVSDYSEASGKFRRSI